MTKPFLLFLFFSLLMHVSLVLIHRRSASPFELPLKRGEPFEISKQGTGVRPVLPLSSKGETISAASKSVPQHGITDGSEFGITKPKYPERSRLRQEEGKVLIKLSLDAEHSLVKAEVMESSGYPALDRSALTQVLRDLPPSPSKPIALEHLVQFNFSLSSSK